MQTVYLCFILFAFENWNITLPVISWDFAKVGLNFTELKNFTIVLSVFMVVDSQL